MTNFTKLSEKLKRFLASADAFAVKKTGELVYCINTNCEKCIFNEKDGRSCFEKRKEWLDDEYIEIPRLTQREWFFCKAAETGWIARDSTERLYFYPEKPTKKIKTWGLASDLVPIDYFISSNSFEFITWEDEEPWAIEDLLKLEVEK